MTYGCSKYSGGRRRTWVKAQWEGAMRRRRLETTTTTKTIQWRVVVVDYFDAKKQIPSRRRCVPPRFRHCGPGPVRKPRSYCRSMTKSTTHRWTSVVRIQFRAPFRARNSDSNPNLYFFQLFICKFYFQTREFNTWIKGPAIVSRNPRVNEAVKNGSFQELWIC